MGNYKCPKCNKEFNRKAHVEQHLNKKNPCMQTNIILEGKYSNPKNNIEILTNPIFNTNVNKDINSKIQHINLKQELKDNSKSNLICQYCMKTFYQFGNLNKHIKFNCKVKKQQDKEKEDFVKGLSLKDNIIKEKDEIIKDQQVKFNMLFEQNLKLIEQNDKIKKIKELTKINKTIERLEETIPANSSHIINYQLINSIIDKDKKIEELNKILMNKKDNKIFNFENELEFFNEIDYSKKENEKNILVDDTNENKPMNLILNNHIIQFRETDGYINATQLCKAGGKNFGHWNSLESTKELIRVLESNIGIPILDLIDKKIGGNHSNTWIHPDLAIQLAQWSPKKIFIIK